MEIMTRGIFTGWKEITKEDAIERLKKLWYRQLPSTPNDIKLKNINNYFSGIAFTYDDVKGL